MNQKLTKIELLKLSVKDWRNFLSDFMAEKVILNQTCICGLVQLATGHFTFVSGTLLSYFLK